jgi:hypothetical protein
VSTCMFNGKEWKHPFPFLCPVQKTRLCRPKARDRRATPVQTVGEARRRGGGRHRTQYGIREVTRTGCLLLLNRSDLLHGVWPQSHFCNGGSSVVNCFLLEEHLVMHVKHRAEHLDCNLDAHRLPRDAEKC